MTDHIPAHVPSDHVMEFDYIAATEDVDDPYEALMDLDRAGVPDIFYSPRHGGHWVVRRYEDVYALLRDTESFGTYPAGIPPQQGGPARMLPFEADPPDHGRYRRILGPLFTPAATQGLEEVVRTTASQLIDRFASDGETDFVESFAARFPPLIFLGLMDLPSGNIEEFVELAEKFLCSPTEQAFAGEKILAILHRHIEAKMREPAEDWISHLIARRETDGSPMLSQDELVNIAFFLFLAGLDTVKNALSHSWRYLAGRPDLQRELHEKPSAVPLLVEELLRFFTITINNRWAMRDMDFKGAPFRKGDGILMLTPVANRDPRKFEHGEAIDITREINPHLTFSAGPHRCLGSYIARMELRVALEEWSKRIPTFRIREGTVIRSTGGPTLGLASLPIAWDAPPCA